MLMLFYLTFISFMFNGNSAVPMHAFAEDYSKAKDPPSISLNYPIFSLFKVVKTQQRLF